jgi:hypothetical protein
VLADGAVVGRILRFTLRQEEPRGTPAFGHHEDRTPDARLCWDARGRDGGVREELAAGVGRILINA